MRNFLQENDNPIHFRSAWDSYERKFREDREEYYRVEAQKERRTDAVELLEELCLKGELKCVSTGKQSTASLYSYRTIHSEQPSSHVVKSNSTDLTSQVGSKVSFSTIGLPLTCIYLLLDRDLSDTVRAQCKFKTEWKGLIALSFANEEEFAEFQDKLEESGQLKDRSRLGTSIPKPSIWQEFLSRAKESGIDTLLVHPKRPECPEILKLDVKSASVVGKFTSSSVTIIPLQCRRIVVRTGEKEDPEKECVGIAVLVDCQGPAREMHAQRLEKLVSDDVTQMAVLQGHRQGNQVPVGTSPAILCDILSAQTIIDLFNEFANFDNVLLSRQQTKTRGTSQGTDAGLLPCIRHASQEKIRLFYHLYPSLLHHLSSTYWKSILSKQIHLSDMVFSCVHSHRFSFLDVVDIWKFVFSEQDPTGVFVILPCHMPHLRATLVDHLRIPVHRISVDAYNFEGGLRQLLVAVNSSNLWSGWRILLVEAGSSIAPVDLVRLVSALRVPNVVSFLIYNPVVIDQLDKLNRTIPIEEWKAKLNKGEKRRPGIMLTSMTPKNSLRTLPLSDTAESISSLFLYVEQLSQELPRILLSTIEVQCESESTLWEEAVLKFFASQRYEGEEDRFQTLIVVGANWTQSTMEQLNQSEEVRIKVVDAKAFIDKESDGDLGKLVNGDATPILQECGMTNGSINLLLRNTHLLSWPSRLQLLSTLLDLTVYRGESGKTVAMNVRVVLMEETIDPRYRRASVKVRGEKNQKELRAEWIDATYFSLEKDNVSRHVEHDDTNMLRRVIQLVFKLLGAKMPISVDQHSEAFKTACSRSSTAFLSVSEQHVSRQLSKTLGNKEYDVGTERDVDLQTLTLASACYLEFRDANDEQKRESLIRAISDSDRQQGFFHLTVVIATWASILQICNSQRHTNKEEGGLNSFLALCNDGVGACISFDHFVFEWSASCCATQVVRACAYIAYLQSWIAKKCNLTEYLVPALLVQEAKMRDSYGVYLYNVIQRGLLNSFSHHSREKFSEPCFRLSATPTSVDDGAELFRSVVALHRVDYNTLANQWANFPFGVNEFLQLLDCGPDGALYLTCLTPLTLGKLLSTPQILRHEHLLRKTQRERVVEQIKALSDLFGEFKQLDLDVGCSIDLAWARERVSVVKWLLLEGGCVPHHLSSFFSSEDLENVRRLLSMQITKPDPFVIRLLLQLDVSESELQPSLQEWVSKLTLKEVASAFEFWSSSDSSASKEVVDIGSVCVSVMQKSGKHLIPNSFVGYLRRCVFSGADQAEDGCSAAIPCFGLRLSESATEAFLSMLLDLDIQVAGVETFSNAVRRLLTPETGTSLSPLQRLDTVSFQWAAKKLAASNFKLSNAILNNARWYRCCVFVRW